MSIEAAKVLETAATQAVANANKNTGAPVVPDPKAAAPDPAKDPQISSKLEILSRREQAAVQAERTASERMKQVDAALKRIEEFESIKTSKPLDALKMLGLNYDDLTKVKLLDGEIPPEVEVKKLKTELDNYKQTQEQKEQELAAQAKKNAEEQEKKAINDFKTDINQFLRDNSVRYELIQFEAQENLVFDVIDEHYSRTIDPQTGIGKVMTKAEAADKVEQWLEQKYDKSRSLKKVKALLGLREESPKQAVKPETYRQPPKTLTNNLSATLERPRTNPVTDEERVQRAIAYAKGLRPAA